MTNLSLFNKKRNFQPITLNGWSSEMVIKNRTFHQKHEVQVYFQLKHNYSCDQQMWALRRQIFAAATLELWQSRRIKLSSAISLRCSVCLLVYDVKKKKGVWETDLLTTSASHRLPRAQAALILTLMLGMLMHFRMELAASATNITSCKSVKTWVHFNIMPAPSKPTSELNPTNPLQKEKEKKKSVQQTS